MKNALKRLILTIFMIQTTTGWSMGKPEHSKVESSVNPGKDGKMEMVFRITTNKGIKVNDEGPWELNLTDLNGLKLDGDNGKGSFKKVDFSIPGFKVTGIATDGKKSGTLKYKLRSFICTEDKARCFMEVHTGEQAWNISK